MPFSAAASRIDAAKSGQAATLPFRSFRGAEELQGQAGGYHRDGYQEQSFRQRPFADMAVHRHYQRHDPRIMVERLRGRIRALDRSEAKQGCSIARGTDLGHSIA